MSLRQPMARATLARRVGVGFSGLVGLLSVCGPMGACGDRAPARGEPCRADVSAASCSDPDGLLVCRAFSWHRFPCRGPSRCRASQCDRSIADEGDECDARGAGACSADGAELLRCDGSSMSVVRRCRGERGCYRDLPAAEPVCDDGAPREGDPCEANAGSRCGPDGKTLLACSPSRHRYILERNCLGPKGCFADRAFGPGPWGKGYLTCDVSVGDVGGACEGYVGVGSSVGSGGSFCSTDGKEELTCHEGVLVPYRSCPCSVAWADDGSAWGVGCAESAESGRGREERRSHSPGLRSAAYLYPAEHP